MACFDIICDLIRIETYAGVYKHYGLMHERSYFAHCIHCSGDERAMMLDTKVTCRDATTGFMYGNMEKAS